MRFDSYSSTKNINKLLGKFFKVFTGRVSTEDGRLVVRKNSITATFDGTWEVVPKLDQIREATFGDVKLEDQKSRFELYELHKHVPPVTIGDLLDISKKGYKDISRYLFKGSDYFVRSDIRGYAGRMNLYGGDDYFASYGGFKKAVTNLGKGNDYARLGFFGSKDILIGSSGTETYEFSEGGLIRFGDKAMFEQYQETGIYPMNLSTITIKDFKKGKGGNKERIIFDRVGRIRNRHHVYGGIKAFDLTEVNGDVQVSAYGNVFLTLDGAAGMGLELKVQKNKPNDSLPWVGGGPTFFLS